MEVTTYSPAAMVGILTSRPTIDRFIEVVKTAYRITEIEASSRNNELIEPRQMITFVAYYYFLETCQKAGERFGKDHSTVTWTCRQVTNRLQTDKYYRQLFIDICIEAGIYEVQAIRLVNDPKEVRHANKVSGL